MTFKSHKSAPCNKIENSLAFSGAAGMTAATRQRSDYIHFDFQVAFPFPTLQSLRALTRGLSHSSHSQPACY